uniref:Uncharacterized protein n=1 Tax=Anguilla anguilla TaxID=7936 RepID=A0A0E9U9I0_ANGAN
MSKFIFPGDFPELGPLFCCYLQGITSTFHERKTLSGRCCTTAAKLFQRKSVSYMPSYFLSKRTCGPGKI